MSDSVPVTVDNFIRAESDKTFSGFNPQGFGKFQYFRELAPIDHQIVQRGNRDTLYSTGVFDLDAGPVTIALPNAGKRFMTMIVIDEDHYVFMVVYGTGSSHALLGRRSARATPWRPFVSWSIRTMPNDVAQAHALQDAIKVQQPGGPGRFRDTEVGRSKSEKGARCA